MCECPDLYCSQQIDIPPTFPYLLRQYCKAAIRTQPTDLLRWSTAYFRCLSLNLRPPVKPRLEYPIPQAYCGMTPGWLKALMYQLANNLTVAFHVLWDRWIGACLQHESLISLLVLGGFKDPYAIPWLQFVGVCAGHLTENLTQTMILFCEIVTEEPEGGSAMITLETFLDVYELLARIDASVPQTLPNLYFTDSLLSLFREPSEVVSKESTIELEEERVEEEPTVEEEGEAETYLGPSEEPVAVVLSCPDIVVDNYKTEDDFLAEVTQAVSEDYTSPKIPSEVLALENADLEKEIEEKDSEKELKPEESVETLVGYMPEKQAEKYLENQQDAKPEEEEEGAREEIDYELKKLKDMLEMEPEIKKGECYEGMPSEVSEREGEGEEEEEGDLEEGKYNYVLIDAAPGIGPKVPEKLIEAVCDYMRECAKEQHGMVMPRNIRHFNCPPLEVLPV
ncbi:hypothetical protein FQR65_LT14754 [Abscondita terminalis]|nr:hypothetical protein FQR65_LT14754 [Abscondita terminalis]